MVKLLGKMKYVKMADILEVFVFLLAFPFAILFKAFRKEFWLISENGFEARDNGYHLFKYIRTNYPNDNVYYAIKKDSPDYEKVAVLGNTIRFGGFVHWVYYLASGVNISSQKGGGPNAAVCYILEVYGLWPTKRVFLQHGITYRDCNYLHYNETKFSMIMCSAYPEYKFIKEKFGYPAEAVKYVGMCRFDTLEDKSENKKHILLMPTWRKWIANPTSESKRYENVDNFKDTEYYRNYNCLINNSEFYEFLERENMKLIFYPHRNMQRFIEYFASPGERVVLADSSEYDVQELLKKASLLITDYSSVFFDFGYMGKPIAYYQFDIDKFKDAHYKDGYFSYQKDGFGPVFDNGNDVVEWVKLKKSNNFKVEDVYSNRLKNFFSLRDADNCKRTYDAVRNLATGMKKSI